MAVVLGVTASLLVMCVAVVFLVRARRAARGVQQQLKMTVYPLADASKPDARQEQLDNDVRALTQIDATEERSPDLIPDGDNIYI